MTWHGFRDLPQINDPSLPEGRFVCGTDTDVGKTHFICETLKALQHQGRRVGAYKPIASGYPREDARSDASRLHAALGGSIPIERINPQALLPAYAPPIAAEIANQKIDEALLYHGAFSLHEFCDWLLVEGAGGLLSPITWSLTNADLAKQFNYPLILVAANRLGCVHQVLSTVQVALDMGLTVDSVIMNCVSANQSEAELHNNIRLLEPFLRRLDPTIAIRQTQFISPQ
jgi:dethiobiotin synthetase